MITVLPECDGNDECRMQAPPASPITNHPKWNLLRSRVENVEGYEDPRMEGGLVVRRWSLAQRSVAL